MYTQTANEAISLADAESVLEQRMGMQSIGSNKTVIAEVWGYWTAKRTRFKKPLLRRFWPVTSINDTNPHLVFRPREKERCVLLWWLGNRGTGCALLHPSFSSIHLSLHPNPQSPTHQSITSQITIPQNPHRYKLRKHRKNDGEAYRRLELLRRDFKQVQDLLALVRKR